jgi:hypothetical protein
MPDLQAWLPGLELVDDHSAVTFRGIGLKAKNARGCSREFQDERIQSGCG